MSVMRTREAGWKPLAQPGVGMKVLRSDKATGQATFLLHFDAGANVPLHDHPGGEEIDYLYTPPDGKHDVATDGGCILLVTLPRPVRFVEPRG